MFAVYLAILRLKSKSSQAPCHRNLSSPVIQGCFRIIPSVQRAVAGMGQTGRARWHSWTDSEPKPHASELGAPKQAGYTGGAQQHA